MSELRFWRSRLDIFDETFSFRATITSYWETWLPESFRDVMICRAISGELVGNTDWTFRLRSLLPVACFLRRWRIGPDGGGFLDDRRLSGTLYEGTRLPILTPGLVRPILQGKINWIAPGQRTHYTQIPMSFEVDWEADEIWLPYLGLLRDWASVNLSTFPIFADYNFHFTCRDSEGNFRRPIAFSIDERPSRQLHRRERI